ncbi:hypothetical protein BAUCODRAFT_34808 [Baudoinia panamericana UAMH 10762]|uniref:Uncharacterized protein n=1 Tax=Baudoinia panamericana (strain UAMH 10762) TaxID=717646 RepID=M2LNV1_BAUPA|nr:uncharacterized protein BAUCODRAFT_34808 [Baudoinia panamericana UAMH 10762]EMC96042.1 hypothetical protein BAUCODRAFT_34808 [Baudoinia panamericana UAMH 10762]
MPGNDEPKEDKDVEMDDAEPEANGEGKKVAFERPPGCWFWLDNATYTSSEANGESKRSDDQKISKPGESFEGENKEGETKSDPEKALKDSRGGSGLNALDHVKADENDTSKTEKVDSKDEPADGGAAQEPAVEEDKQREEAEPDNLLEKGVIYFFTRGRVGVDEPESVTDIQRSYFVLRPLPPGGKITDGAIQDVSNNRLIALPKKVWPKSGRDRFMAFVEKAGTSMDTLKEEFFQGSDYSTKTTGTRHTPEVTPLGEGVYAITATGSGRTTTHLSYMLTIPQELGEVQKDFGLAEKGSFVLSTKNPESSSPANAALPQGPGYPKEIMDEFGSRGWLPTRPAHLNYANGQILLIGESSGIDAIKEDTKDGQQTAEEELEKLEHEDDLRIEHLAGDETIFADLGISSKDYPKVKSTW